MIPFFFNLTWPFALYHSSSLSFQESETVMEQLSHEPSIRHFSHPHPLDLASHHGGGHPQNPLLPSTLCSVCTLPPHGYMYACKTCNYSFTLHVSCAELPSYITHPSHPKHHLTLLQSNAYGGRSFICDACGKLGAAFCYHCEECNFGMHTSCAVKPLTVAHRLHHHQLNLEFFPPYPTRWFTCDICQNAGSNHWLYRCASCEFDAHLDCATAPAGATGQSSLQSPPPQHRRPTPQPVHLQHQISSPGPYALPQHQLQHQHSAPAAVNMHPNGQPQPYMQPAVAPVYRQQPAYNPQRQPQQPPLMVSPVYAQQQQPRPYLQPQLGPAPPLQQTMMDTMVQNFIGGVAQDVGQIAVQNILGGGGADPTNCTDPSATDPSAGEYYENEGDLYGESYQNEGDLYGESYENEGDLYGEYSENEGDLYGGVSEENAD